jgi:hypothetical protein
MGATLVDVVMRGPVGVDGHAADRILHRLAHVSCASWADRELPSIDGTAAAPVPVMRTMVMLAIAGGLWASRAAALTDAPRSETPRATDLLRAERLAEEVRRRLELPPARVEAGWRRGGQGWRRKEPVAKVATDGDVIINVKPAKSPR